MLCPIVVEKALHLMFKTTYLIFTQNASSVTIILRFRFKSYIDINNKRFVC